MWKHTELICKYAEGTGKMSALEKVFQGYYEERLGGKTPDPREMCRAYERILEELDGGERADPGDVMEIVSQYGMQAEKTGFMAGFRMAWELLKNMQEGGC